MLLHHGTWCSCHCKERDIIETYIVRYSGVEAFQILSRFNTYDTTFCRYMKVGNLLENSPKTRQKYSVFNRILKKQPSRWFSFSFWTFFEIFTKRYFSWEFRILCLAPYFRNFETKYEHLKKQIYKNVPKTFLKKCSNYLCTKFHNVVHDTKGE